MAGPLGHRTTPNAEGVVAGAVKGSSYNVGFCHNESKGILETKDTLDKGIKRYALKFMVKKLFDGKIKIAENLYIKPFSGMPILKGIYPMALCTCKNDYNSTLINTGSQAVYNFNGGTSMVYSLLIR